MTIDEIEAITFQAWPASEELLIDGWMARFAEGYTRRVNAASFLRESPVDPLRLIDKVERWFLARNQSPTFRVVDRVETGPVEKALDLRGYQREDRSIVMTARVDNTNSALLADDVAFEEVSIWDWMTLYNSFSKETSDEQAQMRLLERTPAPRAFGVIKDDGIAVACGIAIVVRDTCGFFGIVTNPEARRKGYGDRIMRALARWGQAQGATFFYLQVRGQNHAARKMYEKLGFRDEYTYSFRVPGNY